MKITTNCSVTIAYTLFGLPQFDKRPDGHLDFKRYASHITFLKDAFGLMEYLFTLNLRTNFVEPTDELQIGRRLKNGSYTGVVGLLQRGEAEINMFPAYLSQDKPVWNYAIPFYHTKIAIASARSEIAIFPLNLFYSLRTFEALVWTLMALILVMLLILRFIFSKKNFHEVFNTLFQVIHVITKHHIVDSMNNTPRRLLVPFIFFFSFSWMFFDAGMVNNLVDEDPGFLVDTIDDLFTPQGMSYKPMWLAALDMHSVFANSPIGSKKRALWQRALDRNIDDSLLGESMQLTKEFLDYGPRFRNCALFCVKELAVITERYMCDKIGVNIYISKGELGYAPSGIMFRFKNDSCIQYKKDLVFKRFEKFMQQGYISYALRTIQTTRINDQNHWKCLKPDKEFPYHKQNQVAISNIQLCLLLLLLSYIVFLIIFILEKKKMLFRNCFYCFTFW